MEPAIYGYFFVVFVLVAVAAMGSFMVGRSVRPATKREIEKDPKAELMHLILASGDNEARSHLVQAVEAIKKSLEAVDGFQGNALAESTRRLERAQLLRIQATKALRTANETVASIQQVVAEGKKELAITQEQEDRLAKLVFDLGVRKPETKEEKVAHADPAPAVP